jgi:hypothetical protein
MKNESCKGGVGWPFFITRCVSPFWQTLGCVFVRKHLGKQAAHSEKPRIGVQDSI